MIRRLGLGLFFVFILSIVTSAQEIKFYAFSDAQQVVEGAYFEVTFTIENAKGNSFQTPSFNEFILVAGPNQSSQISIINGRSSQKISYTYVLSPIKIGSFTIGSATVQIDGKTYKTEPIKIEVVKANTQSTRDENGAVAAGDNILEVELSYDTAFVGQQLTLSFVLLSAEDVRSYDFSAVPKFDGFFAQPIQRFNSRPVRIVRDGKQYVSRVLQVYALYPQQKGVFQIDPAVVELGISTSRSNNSFFFNTRLRPVRVQSKAQTVYVSQLPGGAPLSFCGGVGDFYMGTSVDKNSITQDDAITLTLQVKGFGDGKFIEAPKQNFGNDFEIYEPNLINEQQEQQGDRVLVVKTYEYLLLPKRTGTITFRPEMSFYHPDSMKYERVIGQQYSVNVIQGTNRQSSDLLAQAVELPPIYATTALSKKGKPFVDSPIYWGLNGSLILGFLGLLVSKKMKDDRDGIDIKDIRQAKARKVAERQLAAAQSALDHGNIKDYYIELRKAVMQYLADKLKLETTQMSKADMSNLLDEKGLSNEIPALVKLLERGEQAIYASVAPENAHEDYQVALDVIGGVELTLLNS